MQKFINNHQDEDPFKKKLPWFGQWGTSIILVIITSLIIYSSFIKFNDFIIVKVKLNQTHIIDSVKIRGEGTIIPSNNNLSGIKIGQDIYLISNDLSITKQIKGNITYISFEEYNNSSDSNKSHFPIIIEFETTHIEELKTNETLTIKICTDDRSLLHIVFAPILSRII